MAYTQYPNNAYNAQRQGTYAPPPPPQYVYSPAQGYVPGYPAPAPAQKNGAATASLVLGIISMIAWLLPIAGIPLAIVGIVQANRGRRLFTNRTMATVGLVLCIIALVLAVINSAAGIMMAMQ